MDWVEWFYWCDWFGWFEWLIDEYNYNKRGFYVVCKIEETNQYMYIYLYIYTIFTYIYIINNGKAQVELSRMKSNGIGWMNCDRMTERTWNEHLKVNWISGHQTSSFACLNHTGACRWSNCAAGWNMSNARSLGRCIYGINLDHRGSAKIWFRK